MRIWTEKQKRAIDVMARDYELVGAEDEIKAWIDGLMTRGASFDSAFSQASILFAE